MCVTVTGTSQRVGTVRDEGAVCSGDNTLSDSDHWAQTSSWHWTSGSSVLRLRVDAAVRLHLARDLCSCGHHLHREPPLLPQYNEHRRRQRRRQQVQGRCVVIIPAVGYITPVILSRMESFLSIYKVVYFRVVQAQLRPAITPWSTHYQLAMPLSNRFDEH